MNGLLRNRLVILAGLGLAIGAYMAAGCGSSGSSGSTSDTGGASADASSLKSVPGVDVSSYDPSTSSSSSSSESAPLASKSLTKAETTKAGDHKYDTRFEGASSRAGCEQNMHKKEIIRFSEQAQLPRCYIQEMEAAGLITIPTDGTRKAFAMVEPAVSAEERTSRCSGIPSERKEERAACEGGDEGPGAGAVAARLGIISGALEIDVCFGKTLAALALENESTYVGGTSPSFKVVEIGKHGGRTEKHSLTGALSGVSSISDGEVTLGESGKALITAKMDGGFGSGTMTFDANKKNYSLSGGFKGGFKDPFSGAETSFTGKVYAQVGTSATSSNISVGKAASDTTVKGTAKFSFTGTNPPMPLRNMIPFDVASDANFYTTLGAEIGCTITKATVGDVFTCPNPNFDPENPSKTVKPMTCVAKNATCSTVTHTGVESFEVTTVKEDNAFKSRLGALADRFAKRTQTFKSIANSASPFFTAVNAFDLSKLEATAGTIAFERNWDCKDISTTLDLSDISKIDVATLAKLQKFSEGAIKCSAIEEKGRDNDGMGGHNCAGQENAVVVEQIRKEPPSFGNAGGDYTRSGNNCIPQGFTTNAAPERFFVSAVDTSQGKYCMASEGSCKEFTVSSSTVSSLSIPFTFPQGTSTLTQIAYPEGTGVTSKATAAVLSFTLTGSFGSQTCTENFTISQPGFTTAPSAPAQGAFPETCKTAGITDQFACEQFCHKPENKCF